MASAAPLSRPRLTTDALAALSRRFETSPTEEIVRWAVDRFHPELCLTSSMTDAVLIDLVVAVEPSVEVVFIDTGYHFAETLLTAERVRRHYDLNLRVMRPSPPPAVPLWQSDPERCCSAMKVDLLGQALAGKVAWMSGLRRCEAATRADAPVVHLDHRGLVKINPLATWSDDDLAAYIARHDVPVNPLVARGFTSIGCQPCTRPTETGEHPRAGRWAELDKTECGLHL